MNLTVDMSGIIFPNDRHSSPVCEADKSFVEMKHIRTKTRIVVSMVLSR